MVAIDARCFQIYRAEHAKRMLPNVSLVTGWRRLPYLLLKRCHSSH